MTPGDLSRQSLDFPDTKLVSEMRDNVKLESWKETKGKFPLLTLADYSSALFFFHSCVMPITLSIQLISAIEDFHAQ